MEYFCWRQKCWFFDNLVEYAHIIGYTCAENFIDYEWLDLTLFAYAAEILCKHLLKYLIKALVSLKICNIVFQALQNHDPFLQVLLNQTKYGIEGPCV